jgi:hypothetical protein
MTWFVWSLFKCRRPPVHPLCDPGSIPPLESVSIPRTDFQNLFVGTLSKNVRWSGLGMLVVEFLYRKFCKYIFPGVVSAGFSGMGPISVGDQFPGFLQEVGLRFGWPGDLFLEELYRCGDRWAGSRACRHQRRPLPGRVKSIQSAHTNQGRCRDPYPIHIFEEAGQL